MVTPVRNVARVLETVRRDGGRTGPPKDTSRPLLSSAEGREVSVLEAIFKHMWNLG